VRSSRARSLVTPRRLVVLGVAAALLLGAGGWALTRSDPAAAAATTQVVQASSSTIRQTVSASGTLQPERSADLSFAVSGTVTSIPVEVGQEVKKGQTLATVGASVLASAVTTAQASVEATSEQLQAEVDADASDTQLAAARAQLASARTQLEQAEQDRADARLTSTIKGTVAAIGLAVGDRVSGDSGSSSGSSSSGSSGAGASGAGAAAGTAASTTSSSSTGITVISTDSYLVEASVGSADLAQVRKGLQAEITPSGSATKVYGTVASVGIVASSSSSGSATFPVVIDVTGTPQGLYAGGTATVSIIVKQLDGVLTVPTQALTTTDGATTVNQMKDGKQVSTPVTVGTSYGATTEIETGLAVGDQVVVPVTRPGGQVGGRTGTQTGGQTGYGGGQTGGQGGFPQGGGGFPQGGAPAGGVPGANG